MPTQDTIDAHTVQYLDLTPRSADDSSADRGVNSWFRTSNFKILTSQLRITDVK
jgi:hypothetical protein